jgi:hypothetical protein
MKVNGSIKPVDVQDVRNTVEAALYKNDRDMKHYLVETCLPTAMDEITFCRRLINKLIGDYSDYGGPKSDARDYLRRAKWSDD